MASDSEGVHNPSSKSVSFREVITKEGSSSLETATKPTIGELKENNNTLFEQALQTWAEIDLPILQKQLDKQALILLENQKESVTSRKNLATKTKEFKKIDNDKKLKEFKNLLKLYQKEIDDLTKKNKYSESSFLNVYKILADANDPKPLLEASIDSVITAMEVNKLSEENINLRDKLSKYADYDSLKDKLKQLENKSSINLKSKLESKELEMKAIIDEKEINWNLKEKELERQIIESRKQIKELRANYEVTEARLDAQTKILSSEDDRSTSNSLDIEFLARDLEAAKLRALEVEKRNEELRRQLQEKTNTKDSSITSEKADALEGKITDLQSENSLLISRIENQEKFTDNENRSIKLRIDGLQRDVTHKENEIKHLKQKMESMQDYEDIKQELGILKAIEFGEEDDAVNEGADDNDNDDDDKISQKLEKMLIKRNKKLENDLTHYRVANEQLNKKVSELGKQFNEVNRRSITLQNLNKKLESDLEQSVNHGSGGFNDNMSVYSSFTSVSKYPPPQVRPGGRISPASSVVASMFGGDDGNNNYNVNNGSAMLPIVTQQRDRFKKRTTELENELHQNSQNLLQLRTENESLKIENADLFRKARFAPRQTNNSHSRYNDYEDEESAYDIFRGTMANKAWAKMNLLERITYSLSRVILKNRISRNLFAIYTFALHFILVLMFVYISGLQGTNTSIDLPIGKVTPLNGVIADEGVKIAPVGVGVKPPSLNMGSGI